MFRLVAFSLLIVRNFAMVPLALRYIGTYEYNAWLAGGSLISQLTTLDFGLSGVVQQQAAMAHGSGNRDRLERIVGTGLLVIAAMSVCIAIVGSTAGLVLPYVLGIRSDVSHPFSDTFIAASIATGIQVLTFALAGVLAGMQRPIAVGAGRTGVDVFSIALTMVLMVQGYGLASIAVGMVARAVLELAITAIVFRRIWVVENDFAIQVARAEVAPLFRLSLAQFLSQVAGRLKSSLDPVIVGAVLGVDIAASYALTTRAHEAVRALVMQVMGALQPAMSHLFGESSVPRLREVSLGAFRVTAVMASIGMGAIVLLNESFVRIWVGESHYAGNAVTVAASIWGLLSLMGGVSYDQVIAIGEFKRAAVYVWLELALRIPIMVAGLLTVGIVAIPASSIFSQAVAFNWRMTTVLFSILKFPPGSVRSLNGLLIRHALIPFGLGTLGLCLGLAWSTWTSIVTGGALFLLITSVASYAADPYLRSAVRRGSI